MPIRTIYDQGYPVISKIDSYLKSRYDLAKARKEGYKNEAGVCKYCNGAMERETSNGRARCICWLLQHEAELKHRQFIASTSQSLTWKSWEPWGSPQSMDQLIIAQDKINEWTISMDKWLVISGGFGVGKTHLLYIINTMFEPWSLYISTPDFEQLVFDNTGNGGLEALLATVMWHPILLLDDIGADYGSKYPVSMIRKVIDFRYRMHEELPLVVTTNLSRSQMDSYDGRTASRIGDKSKTIFIELDAVIDRRKEWQR